MRKANYKAVFNRLNKLNKDGRGLIQIECYLSGKRKYLSTGIKIEPRYWDAKNNRIKNSFENFAQLNRIITNQISELEGFEFLQLEKQGRFSLDSLDLVNVSGLSEKTDFLSFCYENLEKNNSISIETFKGHRFSLKKLETFRKNIKFEDINYQFIKEFDHWLREQNLKQNTIAKHHKNIKIYLNLAIKYNVISYEANPYKLFKVKKEQTKRNFLTLDEVDKIRNIKFSESTKSIEFIRDMFVFSCYTGLRYSDVQALTNQDIVFENNEYFIDIRQVKTKDYLKLPVSLLFGGKAVEIIEKYRNEFQKMYLFPRLSNQKANLKLKVISLLSDIDKELTFHLSRHTFGTNLASATSDQFLIKELMGHADIKTSMIYIHTSQEQIREKLKKTNW
jgi:site-specific recombinase XerD